MSQWLRDPRATLPDPKTVSIVEISKILSTITVKKLSTPSSEYWSGIIAKLITSSWSPSSLVSTVHILDRIASMGVIDDQVDRLMKLVASNPHRLTPMDSFIGARAILLLGHNCNIVFCTSNNLKSMSNQNLTLLAKLAHSCGSVEFGSRISKIVVEKLNGNLNSFSTTDLIAAVTCLATSSTNHHRSLTALLKSCGTELVRRIELGFVSPHSCVAIVELFSGNPPAPIHPLLLQACYAFLLADWNYKSLTRDEMSRVIYASILSEVENLVFSPIVVREFVSRRKPLSEDPRIALRMMSAISLSKARIDPSLIHSVSRDICIDKIKSTEDASVVVTAFLNALYNNVCLETVETLLNSDLASDNILKTSDLGDLASFALLASASRDMTCFAHHDDQPEPLPAIPDYAVEITGKANPALPRNDLKKKRLVKRIVARGESIVGVPAKSPEGIKEVCFTSSFSAESVFLESILRCWEMIVQQEQLNCGDNLIVDLAGSKTSRVQTSGELRGVSLDIFSSLVFGLEDVCLNASIDELEKISQFVDFCLRCLSENPSKVPMESRDGMEDSVKTVLGGQWSTVNSPIRISLVLDGYCMSCLFHYHENFAS